MDRLSGEDAAWLHMESAENLMLITGFLETAVPLQQARLEEILRQRLRPFARLRSVLVEDGAARWEPIPDFDPASQVTVVEQPLRDDGELAQRLGRWVSQPLDRARPLWRMQLVRQYRTGSAVLFQVHHAIADGFALMQVLLTLCEPQTQLVLPRSVSAQRRDQPLAKLRSLAGVLSSPVDSRTLLKGHLQVPKRVAWSAPLALPGLKAAARARKSTLNDLLVASVAGALRRYLLEHEAPTDGQIHAMMPVNLRSRSEALAELGNRFGIVIFPLPVQSPDPQHRLLEVKRRMGRVKGSPDAHVGMALLQLLGHLPTAVERLAVAFFARKATTVLTNVPGPREQLWLADAPISRIMFWVPQTGKLGLGISLFSYCDELSIGVLSDAGLMPDPERLVAYVTEELAA